MVLISSVSALGNRGQLNYSAAKAGIQAMTKTLAIELGRFAVNVNCVAPGFVSTAMTRQTAERIGVDFEDFQKMGAETHRAAAGRRAGGHRERDRLPLLGGRVVRDRPGAVRGRRPPLAPLIGVARAAAA